MNVMGRLGHTSCACAKPGASTIPSANTRFAACFIEFSSWLSEPDKQVPCRCANLWNHVGLASAATSHARALQPARGPAASPSLELWTDRVTARLSKMAGNRGAEALPWMTVETVPHVRVKSSCARSIGGAGVVRRGRAMLTMTERGWLILPSLAAREGGRCGV